MNTHSPTTASDLIKDLVALNEDIQNTLLIGEKVAKIYETGRLYNHLRSLITPDYLMDEELEWFKETSTSWNNDVIGYAKQQTGNTNIESSQGLEDLESTIQNILDDIIGGLDDVDDYLEGI